MAKDKSGTTPATAKTTKARPKTKPLERHDVIAMARKFADDLEAGEYGTPLNAMLVLECAPEGEEPGIELFGWGPNASSFHGLGMLAAAMHILQE